MRLLKNKNTSYFEIPAEFSLDLRTLKELQLSTSQENQKYISEFLQEGYELPYQKAIDNLKLLDQVKSP